MAATQSFGAFAQPRSGKRSSGARSAELTHLRLRLEDEDTLRYVFCDWETDCGVRSNHTAQVEALVDRSFRRSIDAAEREIRRERDKGGIRLALDAPRSRKVPLALRGWPSENVRISKNSGPTVRSDREAQPQRWTHAKQGAGGRNFRAKILAGYRALVAMGERGAGGHVVVLFKLYGPRDPAADYLRWPDFAPIAHLTKTAEALAVRATKALRRSIAEGHAARLPNLLGHEAIQAERLRILDRLLSEKPCLALTLEQVHLFDKRLEELDRVEKSAATFDLAGWIARRAEAERATVEPRHALEAHLRHVGTAERDELVHAVDADAGVMVARAATAFYSARAELAR